VVLSSPLNKRGKALPVDILRTTTYPNTFSPTPKELVETRDGKQNTVDFQIYFILCAVGTVFDFKANPPQDK
jgi:hypothetical protein